VDHEPGLSAQRPRVGIHTHGLTAGPLPRLALVLVATAAAYHFTLTTLLSGLGQQTPLAYLGLVPLVGLALMCARGAGWRPGGQRDSLLDAILGIGLLSAALFMLVALPVQQSSIYWLLRLDLLSLPLFVAGLLALVFGAALLWRVRLGIVFLLLSWPPPFLLAVGDGLGRVTAATLAALHTVLRVLPVASPAAIGDGSLFLVSHAGSRFVLSVSSACSGANSLVGFALVGMAFVALVRGPVVSKLTWLACGLALVWLLDLARILSIFATGAAAGESFAIDVLHPYIGLAAFNLGVLAMVLALPLFRLRLGRRNPSAAAGGPGRTPPPQAGRAGIAGHAAGAAAISLVLIAAIAAGISDGRLQGYQLLAQDLGPPRLAAADALGLPVSGYKEVHLTDYPWISQYFGRGATWNRNAYLIMGTVRDPGEPGPLSPVLLDVITSADLSTFTTYGIEACYQFHNYPILEQSTADLGGGVTGHIVVYDNRDLHSTWTAVYWIWPVAGPLYQRIVLNVYSPETVRTSTPKVPGQLAGFARDLIAASARQGGRAAGGEAPR
jgi:exosortase/archaeosortase family protein